MPLFHLTITHNGFHDKFDNMKNKILHIRVSAADQRQLKSAAEAGGFKSVSDYVRHKLGLPVKIPKMIPNPKFQKSYTKPESKPETLENTGL